MVDEGNGGQVRRMDLNLYLGLPRRLPEPDLGLDLVLGSIPLFSEMSNSNNPSISRSAQPPVEITHHGSQSHDLEYNPYSPSYGPISPILQTNLEEQTLVIDGVDDLVDLEHPPYLPSYVQISSTDVEGGSNNDVEYVPYPLPSFMMAPLSPSPVRVDEVNVQEESPHVPYIPVSPVDQVHEGHSSTHPIPDVIGFAEPYQSARNDLLERELLQCPEVRFRRLIESSRRLRLRRYRSPITSRVNSYSGGQFSSNTSHEVPDQLIETNNGTQKTSVEDLVSNDLEEGEVKNQSSGAANFDCNVCLDVAKEPVVTSCGHLFCWPCLYQWLHIHCGHKECPVCKGEVTESNITPIYGRGSSETGGEKRECEDGGSSLKIPPRPHGRRLESFRQRMRRPLLRRSREESSSWRLIVNDEDLHNEPEGLEESEEPSMQGILEGANRRMLTRFMAAQQFRREDNSENGLNLGGIIGGSSTSATEIPINDSDADGLGGWSRSTPPALSRRGFDFLRRIALYSVPSSDRLSAIAADLSGVVGRMGNSGSNSVPLASASMNPRDPPDTLNVLGNVEAVAATDQASASSTIAVIQGDPGVAIDAPIEPNSVGSSRTLRRRRRSSVSGTLDVDGGVHHACKRRSN